MSGHDRSIPADEELEEVFETLRSALSTLPEPSMVSEREVPAAVVDGARWVHDWVNMNAELAQLTHDTSLDGGLATVRSTTPLRHITFECGSHQIQIEIEPAQGGVSMTGTVLPATVGTVQALVGGISHQGSIDDLGTFLIDNVHHGVVMAYITMENGTIRLGSFEV